MNCKQIDELLPLYAGHDLDEKRTRLVSEHIQICVACARGADEYRETVELAQHFAPPVFAENAYASVRQQVLRQIENESAARRAPQMFGGWFRPRRAWAVASVLIIAFGFLALYLLVNRDAKVQPVANNQPTLIEQPGSTAASPRGTSQSAGAVQKPVEKQRRIIRSVANRSLIVAAKTRNSSTASISPKLRDPDSTNDLPAVDAGESPMRVEMQTKDPNIRIIWFSQTNSKPALPNVKGI